MAGYRIEVSRQQAIWLDKDKVTELSKVYPKLMVDFIRERDGYVYFKWIPTYEEVIRIVGELLKDENSTKLREDLIRLTGGAKDINTASHNQYDIEVDR